MSKPFSTSYFIEQATNNFGSKLDCSTVQHKNANIKVTIICPEHMEFSIFSHSHLNSLHRSDSELERFIKNTPLDKYFF